MNAGLWVGGIAGIVDAIVVLLENPASFTGFRSPAGFVGATLVLYLAGGTLLGLAFLAIGRVIRAREESLVALGLGAALFVGVAIRVHVRWYFGVPLTSPQSAPAYSGVALAAALASALATRLARRPLSRALDARLGRPAAWTVALAFAFVLAGQPARRPPDVVDTPPRNATDILLITLDTTRADHLSCYGYPRGTTPAIDRLARRGIQVRSAYAAIPLTNPSHTTILTGLLPSEHRVLNNGTPYEGAAPTLSTTLSERGYHCAAFVSGIPLKAGISGLDRGFATYDDSFSKFDRLHPMVTSLAAVRAANRIVPTELVERRAEDTVRAALRWLRSSESPRFLWVHLYDAHSPYDAPSTLLARFQKEDPLWRAHGKEVTAWPISDYDAEIREVDRHLEDLVRAFEERAEEGDGAHDPGALVLLTADHGEGLEQHGQLTHGQLLFEEDLRVPWIETRVRIDAAERRAARAGTILEEPRGLVSFRALALDAAGVASGLDEPHALDAFLAQTFPPEGREPKAAVIENPLAHGAAGPDSNRKLIVNFTTGEPLAFDLASDPGETRPVDAGDPSWDPLKRRIPAPDSTAGAPIDPEVKRRLESLGYIH